MQNAGQLVRADSWEFPGAAEPRLLKTVSNAQEAAFAGASSALQQAVQPPAACPPPALPPSKPPMAPPQQQQQQQVVPSLSTASTHTAAKAPEGGAAQQLVLPMRQVSLDAITAADLCGGGGGKPAPAEAAPDRSSIFNDVIEQLAAKEESLPVQTGLYTLPSIQFLESLLEDMDSKTASSGHQPAEPPLYLPLDAFDLPFDDTKPSLRQLIHHPSPFDLPQQHGGHHHPHAHMQQQQHHGHGHAGPQQQQQQQVYHISAAATMQQPVAQPAPPHGFIPTSSSMPLLGHAPSSFHGSSHIPHSRSAGPSPVKPSHARRAVSAYADFEYEEMEMSLQMSKSGRMRKVASYAGAKRKVSDVCGAPRLSLPESLPPRQSLGSLPSSHIHPHHHQLHHHHAHPHPHHHAAASESDTGATTLDDESDEEVSKGGNKNRKQGGGSNMKKGGKRTTCLNCGCHQTPQWRCGPLGPRTLCNACGVRYKKGLPLNCWPIREGMVLPPGAVLPPGVHIPGVILQPAEDE